jgi:hypothetical protein
MTQRTINESWDDVTGSINKKLLERVYLLEAMELIALRDPCPEENPELCTRHNGMSCIGCIARRALQTVSTT